MTGVEGMRGPLLVHRWTGIRVPAARRRSWRRPLQLLLVLIGVASLGYYTYTLAAENIYQGYQNWAFDHAVAGGGPVSFIDYLRQQTVLSWMLGRSEVIPSAPVSKVDATRVEERPAVGEVLGRIEIPRLHIEAMVREGVSSTILSKAVGHVPTTALPGDAGNFSIAAHRDTLFRALKDIQKGDLVTFRSSKGQYTYRIFYTRIVKPTEVSVLRPDGALPVAVLQNVSYAPGATRLITLITCYPFYYVGSAPERFIVQGELVADAPVSPRTESRAGPPHTRTPRVQASRLRQTAQVHKPRPARGFSDLGSARVAARPRATVAKKRTLLRRLFHRP